MAKRIYLDYASLTPVDKRVRREYDKYSTREYANPSSIYTEGVSARRALETSRAQVAECIHAHSDEIIFTSGGTESNTLALEGALRAARDAGIQKPHIIISEIEHSSITETVFAMEEAGVEVTRLSVGRDGIVSPDDVRRSIRSNTFMVSVMSVNNEIGTVQPVRDIAKAVRWARANTTKSNYPLLHTDACQAVMYSSLNVQELGVDLLTLDGSKVYGPRGVGALYMKRGTPVSPVELGGGQEMGMRSGTENVAAAAGLAKAMEIASTERSREVTRLYGLRELLLSGLYSIRSDIHTNPANLSQVSPHILNITIPAIDNEYFILQMDAAGVSASTKSSCLRDADESYVLKAIGASSTDSVRFSLGRMTKKGDINKTLKIVARILNKTNK